METLTTHGVLFLVSMLAATILPGSSEAALLALITREPHQVITLTATATVGNTLGAIINWGLGRWLLLYADRRWFPATPKQLQNASELFRRYGVWSLLFSWVPIVGDPLAVIAGVLKVPFVPFVILIALGKLARYILLIGAWRAMVGF
jgi:membrane protein YqaA with SNARE-associated domain